MCTENKISIFLCVWVFYLYVCLCAMCMQCLWRPEESVYLLELEVKSLHVGTWNRTWDMWKSNQC